MNTNKVTLQAYHSERSDTIHHVMLSQRLIKHWKIPIENTMYLTCGSLSEPIKLFPLAVRQTLRVSHTLRTRMNLPNGIRMRLKYRPTSNQLLLGPVIGVLVNKTYTDQPSKFFGATTAFYQELCEAARMEGALIYLFTPHEIETMGNTLMGWYFEGGGWKKSQLPYPNIIYNRLVTRKMENKSSVQQFLSEVKSRNQSAVFNERFLNKVEVFQALKSASRLRTYLPESYLFRNRKLLRTLLDKYSLVFLKPSQGSLGKGIIRLQKLPDHSFECQFFNENGTRKQSFQSFKSVLAAIVGKTRNREYLIQQGLQLIGIGRRPMDFRALVQKNMRGNWSITSIVARVAPSEHFVSNLARGGTLLPYREALAKSTLSASMKASIADRLRQAALELAEGMEEQLPYHFGELGIDIAVDRHGKVWLLEVNSKPSKADNSSLSELKVRPSVRQIIRYSIYKSGFY